MSDRPQAESVAQRTSRGFLVDFRRSLKFVWPHRRYLFGSFAAALGIMLFYTSGTGSLLPILKVMTSDHETLGDWIYRTLVCRRLGVVADVDVPADIPYIGIDRVRGGGGRDQPLDNLAAKNDRILAIHGEQFLSCYELMRRIVRTPDSDVELTIVSPLSDSEPRTVSVRLRSNPWYAAYGMAVADATFYGRDAEGKLRTLGLVMGIFIVLTVLQLICRFWQEYLVELTAGRAMMDMRTSGYGHVLQLPMSFFSLRNTGETLTRFANDTNVLLLGVRTLFGKTIREPMKAVGIVFVVLLVVGWELLFIILFAALPAGFIIHRFGRIIRRSQRRALRAWDTLLDILQERIGGIRIVKSYTMERSERLRFFREHRRLFKNQLRVQRFDVASAPVLEFLATLVVGGFVLYGGYLVFYDDFDAAIFLTSVGLLIAMFDPLRKLSNVNNRLQQAEAAARRIFDILDEPVETIAVQKPNATVLPRHSQRIEFRDVSFRYPSRPEVPVLRDINLTVPAGETLAIVGPNGSGKTTLCALLLRFYTPESGDILIDGHDIRDVTIESLRRQIGLVTQDTVIFTDTVSANIAYGRRHVDPETIRNAARTAYADEFIQRLSSPPESSRNGHPPRTGYDAIITSGTLSGGQKQRLAISRALVRDPAILIFDEATSQIDPESARRIHDAVRAVRRNRTAFLIAHHDREMLAEADRVVVMDKGQIAAVGTHAELLKSCSLYQNLYETQFVPQS